MNKVKLVVYVSKEQRAALELLRQRSGASIGELVRRLLDKGLASVDILEGPTVKRRKARS